MNAKKATKSAGSDIKEIIECLALYTRLCQYSFKYYILYKEYKKSNGIADDEKDMSKMIKK